MYDYVSYSVLNATRALWQHVVQVDVVLVNPTVSEITHNAAKRRTIKRIDEKSTLIKL